MAEKWKVRVMLPAGEIGEVEAEGSLAEVAAADYGAPVMVMQRVAPPAAPAKADAGKADAAKGAEAVSVQKK